MAGASRRDARAERAHRFVCGHSEGRRHVPRIRKSEEDSEGTDVWLFPQLSRFMTTAKDRRAPHRLLCEEGTVARGASRRAP